MFGKSENRDDYQGIARPVGGMARNLPAHHLIPDHRHDRAQLIYAASGAILVNAEPGSWIVPPQRAVWVPADTVHSMQTLGQTELRTLYLRPEVAPTSFDKCSVIAVSRLLRELVVQATEMEIEYDESGRDGLVIRLLLLELKPAHIVPLHLPLPKDPRILKMCHGILADLIDDSSIEEWGSRVGASGRTIIRQFQSETGLSFRQWKQQARLITAIQMLAEGAMVADAANMTGYESASAFSAMFRRVLGVSPSDYFKDIS